MPYTRQNVCFMRYAAPILLLIAFCLSGCGTTHQTYIYHGPAIFDLDHSAGSVLSIQWQAKPGQVVTASSPMSLVLEVSVIGPFQHIDDVVFAIQKHSNDPVLAHMGPIVAAAPPIQTNNWTSKTFTSVLSFPATLQSGYYALALTVNGDAATRENVFVRIHAHS